MDISEIQRLRNELNMVLKKEMIAFERATGVAISNISITRINAASQSSPNASILGGVSVEVKL